MAHDIAVAAGKRRSSMMRLSPNSSKISVICWISVADASIGVYKVPSNIKRIYLEGGAWVFGSFIMDGKACSNVKIYGRGVLSGARLHLRESHMVEAKNGADGIIVDGIVIADYSFFAVRLLGADNEVSWTKIVGGWIYNCDGIAAYANSTIRNCFIWANDDNIKIYRRLAVGRLHPNSLAMPSIPYTYFLSVSVMGCGCVSV